VEGNTWSTFLYLTTSQLTSDRIRVLNKYSNTVCYYDIDVYRNRVWTDVFDGYLPVSWYEIGFAEGTVTQMRIRIMRVGDSGIFYILRLYEADFGILQES
jgi:hypothetical protein